MMATESEWNDDEWGGGAAAGGENEEQDFSTDYTERRSNECYKCHEEGHMARDCPTGDTRVCRRCNQVGHVSRDCPEPEKCYNCKGEGHTSRDCPEEPRERKPMKCYNCQEEGHTSRDCPEEPRERKPMKCYNCQEEGHASRDCPEEQRERKPLKCFKCDEEGHRASDCTKPRVDETGKPLPAAVTYVPEVVEVNDEAFDRLHYDDANLSRFESMVVTVSDPEFEQPLSVFEEAGFSEDLLEKIRTKMRYATLTPIQKYCIPIILAGRDLIGCSHTGSGKSAAFILPIVQALMSDPSVPAREDIHGQRTQCPLVVVISPTRELCVQLYEHFRLFTEQYPRRLGVSAAYGGTAVRYNMDQIRSGTHILCAVPGRLQHFVNEKVVSFSNLRYLVLDEADRMLDDGFSGDIQRFNEHETMPAKENRQTLMFSATFSDVEVLARNMMRPDAVKVVVGTLGAVNEDVQLEFIEANDQKAKREALISVLNSLSGGQNGGGEGTGQIPDKVIVFVEQKKDADTLANVITLTGCSSTSMHGDRDQQQREEALRTFRTGHHMVLVATEVAARGLDIKGLNLVINYDLPKDIDKFVHRVGRTGRVGIAGRAISFFSEKRDSALAPQLVKVLTESNKPVPDFISNAAAGGTNDFGDCGFGDDTTAADDGDWGF